MIEGHAHLGYAPRGAGLLYAVTWFAHGPDVFGWYIGAREGLPCAAYFALPRYYTARDVVLCRTAEDDLHGRWLEVTPQGEVELPPPSPVPQELSHDLARLQDEFTRHWLFCDDDPRAADGVHALEAQGFPVCRVNILASRMGKLRPGAAVWRYDAPGADRNVLVHLSRLWPLDERLYD